MYNPDAYPANWVLQLIATDNLHAFYKSPEWRRTRRAVMTCGNTVHHVNELRQRPDLALSEYDELGRVNLVVLCPSCHWERHHKRRVEVAPERW